MISTKRLFASIGFTSLLPLTLVAILAIPTYWIQVHTIEQYRKEGFNLETDSILAVSKVMPSFGGQNLLADFLWLRFVQYFGDTEVREKTGYGLNFEYLQAITDRNPQFENAYLIANLAVAAKMGRTDLAEQLLLKGIQHDPDSYYLWQYRGFLHFMYTGDVKKAAYSFRQNAGLAVAQEGNAKQHWGNYWLLMAKSLETFPPTPWLRRSVWQEIYFDNANKETQAHALKQLKTLGVILKPDGKLYELYPASPPEGYAKRFVYGPPSPSQL